MTGQLAIDREIVARLSQQDQAILHLSTALILEYQLIGGLVRALLAAGVVTHEQLNAAIVATTATGVPPS